MPIACDDLVDFVSWIAGFLVMKSTDCDADKTFKFAYRLLLSLGCSLGSMSFLSERAAGLMTATFSLGLDLGLSDIVLYLVFWEL